MILNLEERLQLIEVLFKNSDFFQANEKILESLNTISINDDPKNTNQIVDFSLRALDLLIKGFYELNKLSEIRLYIKKQIEIISKISLTEDQNLFLNHLNSVYFFHFEKLSSAYEVNENTLRLGIDCRNNSIVCKSLYLKALLEYQTMTNYKEISSLLDKSLVISHSISDFETYLYSLLLAHKVSQIAKGPQNDLKQLTEAYSTAINKGYHNMIPKILFEFYTFHLSNGDKYFAKFISQCLIQDKSIAKYNFTDEFEFDLEILENGSQIKERSKGIIDFKNQTLLIDILNFLIQQQGNRVNKSDLVQEVWKESYNSKKHDNKIYVNIKRLRRLIEIDIEKPKYIQRDRDGYYIPKSISIKTC